MHFEHEPVFTPDLDSVKNIKPQSYRSTKRKKDHKPIKPFNSRRKCRRAGVKRMSLSINKVAHETLVGYLRMIVRRAIIISEHQRRKTITQQDVIYALK